MCFHGTLRYVNIINPNQNKKRVVVDACIADEIQELNNKGVVTLGCCCGHGMAGQISEWENGFGKWKSHYEPPHSLINEASVGLAKEDGYRPIPYRYADGNSGGAWKIYLKTGCMTEEECKEWEINNKDKEFIKCQ